MLIHPTAIIYPGVTLGHNVRIEAYAVIGSPPEQTKSRQAMTEISGRVKICDNCIIREYVTINSGMELTEIGSDCIFLRGSHAGHDAIVGKGVTVACNALIGGHARIHEGAWLGLGAIIHQFGIIGHYAMIGMGGIVTKKSVILPGRMYVGNPVRNIGLNKIGLERAGITEKQIQQFEADCFASDMEQAE